MTKKGDSSWFQFDSNVAGTVGHIGKRKFSQLVCCVTFSPGGGGKGVTWICCDTGMCHYFGYIFGGRSRIFGYLFWAIPGFLGIIFGYSRILSIIFW